MWSTVKKTCQHHVSAKLFSVCANALWLRWWVDLGEKLQLERCVKTLVSKAVALKKHLQRLSVYCKMLWLLWKGILLPVSFN